MSQYHSKPTMHTYVHTLVLTSHGNNMHWMNEKGAKMSRIVIRRNEKM